MASVYNSTPYIPSTGNSYSLDQDNEYQFDNDKWEDIKSYTSVILTVSAGTPGYVKLRWAQGHESEEGDDIFPNDTDITNPLATDQFYYSGDSVLTKQYDTRSRFLNVWFDGSLDGAVDASLVLSTNYKKMATEIKLTDEDVDIVAVYQGNDVSNSLYVGLTDFCGHLINSTLEGQEGEALFNHLADSSGKSLATTDSYRQITRVEETEFSFNNDVNSNDWSTVITETNEFMLPNDGLPVKHGDIVKFLLPRNGETRDTEEIFDTIDGSGYLEVRAKVHFTAHTETYTKFQLLVSYDIGQWFDEDIKIHHPAITNYDEMESGNPDFILYDDVEGTYKLLTHANNTYETVATVDNYYDIIADPSGFNVAAGVTIGPGKIPLDLRFYRGSFHTDNTSQTSIVVERRNDPKESLAVALRDSNNLNMASTQGEDTYHFQHDYCHPSYPRVLIVLDDVNTYPEMNAIEENRDLLRFIAESFSVSGDLNYHNRVLEQTRYIPIFNDPDREDGPCYSVILSTSLNSIVGDTDPDFILPPNQPITTAFGFLEFDFPTLTDLSFNLWETALNTVPLVETLGFTDVVFITANANDFSYGDVSKDELDKHTAWQNVNRYIVVPMTVSGEDLIHFVGGKDERIISYPDNLVKEEVNQPGQFSEIFDELINQIHKTKHEGHNALTVHPADIYGNSQAGTSDVIEAAFGDTALFYSLTDLSAHILDSTYTASGRLHDGSNNAMFVHLNIRQPEKPGCAESINPYNPLPVAFQGEFDDGKMFDLTISGPLTTVNDISNGPINLHSVNIVNETATPVWVRLYDVCSGLASALEEDFSVDLSNNILFNLPVPGLSTRDIPLARPVTVAEGLHFAASTNYRRDILFYPPGKKHIFVNGNYKPVTITASVLEDLLDNDVEA